jgi:hypothetical protein
MKIVAEIVAEIVTATVFLFSGVVSALQFTPISIQNYLPFESKWRTSIPFANRSQFKAYLSLIMTMNE